MAKAVTIRWSGKVVGRRMEAGAMRGLTLWAEHVLQQSRAVAPLDEGTLERSGAVSTDPANLVAAVSFDTPYAVRQHEELSYRHAPGRTAKYLERPLNASRKVGPALVAREIQRVTGGRS